ncbi:glucose-6-phosphate isomerase [Thiotrichales bacterium 19S3-7]|nr:glucose-6-phosphate isomerase [Thiotrichales bacterium 19S3-7]MCF6801335.1 glucose-6-phosphate isomerase [Thiotrichales bacterium 19S3-11]
MINPNNTKIINHLKSLKETLFKKKLVSFFQSPDHFDAYHLSACDILLDYSKNHINHQVMALLFELAESAQLSLKRDQMFAGEKINFTEDRAVLHTALRRPISDKVMLDGVNIVNLVHQSLEKMKHLVESVHNGQWKGYNGDNITDIVNIGIGGSDLGPKMVVEALTPYHTGQLKCHFISNVDGFSINRTLKELNPKTTLFIVASKSFSTEETLMNAKTAREWLVQHSGDIDAVKSHFVAISSQPEKVKAFGIDDHHRFDMWDWVGGRYSLWSVIGLSIALMVGMDNFYALLEGAYEMDQHFLNAPLQANMPVILALIEIWYSNFSKTRSKAILPYDDRLTFLADYLQQADMESNGKSCNIANQKPDYTTGVVLWGGVGTNGQHAFHQLLHQGTLLIPVDFIIARKPHHHLVEHHQALIANALAQAQALMIGKTEDDAYQELIDSGLSHNDAEKLAPHKAIPGSRPSNMIVLSQLTPKTLGSLIALYEHKIFTQGIIWQINSFDQWGVELGKALGKPILNALAADESPLGNYDESTQYLINYFKDVYQG